MIEHIEIASREPLWLVPDEAPARRQRVVAWADSGQGHLEPMVVQGGIAKVPNAKVLSNSRVVGLGELLCTCEDPDVDPADDVDPAWCPKCPGEIRTRPPA